MLPVWALFTAKKDGNRCCVTLALMHIKPSARRVPHERERAWLDDAGNDTRAITAPVGERPIVVRTYQRRSIISADTQSASAWCRRPGCTVRRSAALDTAT